MTKQSNAYRYARVLFNLDVAKNILEKRLSDFESLLKTFAANSKLMNLLKAPHLTIQEKKEILTKCLKENFDETLSNFLYFLIEKRKIDSIGLIASEYRRVVNEHLGKQQVKIVTAFPLESSLEAKLVGILECYFKKKVAIKKEINPDIIGGVLLIAGNQMVDWSITGRLKKIHDAILMRTA